MDHELLILGAGPGGYEAAIRAAQLGLNVGLIERDAVGAHASTAGAFPPRRSCMMQVQAQTFSP